MEEEGGIEDGSGEAVWADIEVALVAVPHRVVVGRDVLGAGVAAVVVVVVVGVHLLSQTAVPPAPPPSPVHAASNKCGTNRTT